MTTQLCECDDWNCTRVVRATIEQFMFIREDPRNVLIAKDCEKGPNPGDELVDEGDNFYVYKTKGV